VTSTGPDQGRARVAIDGTTVATVDNGAASPATRQERTFAGLPDGAHTAEIVVLGSRRGSASAEVTVDAFRTNGTGGGSRQQR
jgi:hypothetical protein